MSQNTSSEFKIECPDCGMTYESHEFKEVQQFVDKHEEHTGHNAEWVRADFELIEPNTEWQVLCVECDEAWWFEAESDAQEFCDEHAEYTDHEINTPITTIEENIPEPDDIDDSRSIKNLIEELSDRYDKGVPEKYLISYITRSDTRIAEIRHELKKLKQRGEVYEPRNGHLRTT